MKKLIVPLILGLSTLAMFGAGCTQQYATKAPTGEAQPQASVPVVDIPAASIPPTATEPSGQKITEITIQNFAFVPNTITVKKGSSVRWTNKDTAPHTVTGEKAKSGNLEQNQSFVQTFNTDGSYTYSCSIHPSMKGTITVEN